MVRVGLDKELGVAKVETEEKRLKRKLINLVVAGIFLSSVPKISANLLHPRSTLRGGVATVRGGGSASASGRSN